MQIEPAMLTAIVIGSGDTLNAFSALSAEVPLRILPLPRVDHTPIDASASIAFVCVPAAEASQALGSLEELTAREPDMPVIAWTEALDESQAEDLLRRGVDEVLPAASATAALVRSAIQRARARVERESTLALSTGRRHPNVSRLISENEDLKNFAHMVAHDLQAPLKQVASFADLSELALKNGNQPQALAYVDRMRQSAGKMSGLITGLLDFSQATASAGPIEIVDLNSLVKEVVVDFDGRISSQGARITVGDLPSVRARRSHLYQLFLNLIDNALKYSGPDSPFVEVGSAKSPEGWRLWVSDRGMGIDPLELESIFELFRRSSRGAGRDGRGIGLSICKRIVESQGGRIWAESKPQEGSCFYFTIPGRLS